MDVIGGVSTHYTVEARGGRFLVIDSSLSAYWDSAAILINNSGKYKFAVPTSADRRFGKGTYTLVADVFAPPSSTPSEEDVVYPVSMALVVSSTMRDTDGELRDIHEVYNYCKHEDTMPGAGKALLDFIAGFTWNPYGPRFVNVEHRLIPYASAPVESREQADNSFVWVGVRKRDIALVRKVYQISNFYFPCILPNILRTEVVTPRGLSISFEFYSGYSSKVTSAYLQSNWAKPMTLSLAREDVKELIGEHPSEEYGSLVTDNYELAGLFASSDTMLKRDRSPETTNRGEEDSCIVYIPNTPVRLLEDKSLRIFSFHTHPFTCHRSAGLLLGFPSELDYVVAAARQFNTYDDGSMIFSREGVFVIQYHPFILYCISQGLVTQDMVEYLQWRFQEYLQIIQYGDKRLGMNESLRNIAKKLQEGAILENTNIDNIYAFDDESIQELMEDTTSFTQKFMNIMPVPPIFIQCLNRKNYVDKSPTFIVPMARMRDPESW